MSESDNISQLLNQALKFLQENDPHAAGYILGQLPAATHSNQFYLYIRAQILRLTGNTEEAAVCLDQLAALPQLSEDVVQNLLAIAVDIPHISDALSALARNVVQNNKLETAASRYLLFAGDLDSLLQAQKKFTSDQARFNAAQAAVWKGNTDLAVRIISRMSDAFKRLKGIAPLLLSIERLAASAVPEVSLSGPQTLAVITPFGPGHEEILQQCRQSVAALEVPDNWQVEHIVIDDSAGQLGRSQARNLGVQQACAAGAGWIYFLDADDLMADQALLHALPYLGSYDAVWGLISTFQESQPPVPRADQLPYIDDRLLLLSATPFQTLQMGVFVRADLAASLPFAEDMNCGEDFDFYFSLWRDHQCIKIPRPFFHNRRGVHSTGPRAASGSSWDKVTFDLARAELETLDQHFAIRGRDISASDLISHDAYYYISEDFSSASATRCYDYVFSPRSSLSALEYTGPQTVWLDSETLAGRGPFSDSDSVLVDLRYAGQRFFDVRVMQNLAGCSQVDVLSSTADDLKFFRCNLPMHQISSSEQDSATQAILTRLTRHKLPAPRFIFIAGYSRSGSTMAYNMLSTTVSNYAFFDEERSVYEIMHRENVPSISKRPLDIFDIKRIFRSPLAAETALMICYRDLRAMLTSKHRGVSDDYFMGYDKTYFLNPREGAQYVNPGIMDTHNTICNAMRESNLHSIVPLRYEDLILHTQNCQDFYGELYGLEYSGNFSDFYKQELGAGLTAPLNDIRAVDRSTMDKWQDPKHADRLHTQFARCPALYNLMEFYGYGPNYQA